jgi:hypothetical protein
MREKYGERNGENGVGSLPDQLRHNLRILRERACFV